MVADPTRDELRPAAADPPPRRPPATAQYRWDLPDDWWWSPEMYELHGYPEPAAVTPSRKVLINHAAPGDRAAVEAVLTAAVNTGLPFAQEYRIDGADGSDRRVVLFAAPERDETGKVARVAGILLDLTSRPGPDERQPTPSELPAPVAALVAPPDSPAELAAQFAGVARALHAEPTIERILARVCELAVSIVDGCDHAGITVVSRGRPETVAASDAVPEKVDALQYQTRQGPCLEAIIEHRTFRSHDLATEHRWPQFAKRAAGSTGVRSMLAYRLFTDQDTLGALNLYAKEPKAFRDEVLPIGAVFAAHAAMAFAAAREKEQIEHLEQAVASNRAIGAAIGILMVTRRLDNDAAFELLRSTSQTTNRKLRDLADLVVRTGDLPTPGRSRS
jgi:hypothetical protein